jgi:hypothetical protein
MTAHHQEVLLCISVYTAIGICHAFMLTGCWQHPSRSGTFLTSSLKITDGKPLTNVPPFYVLSLIVHDSTTSTFHKM